MFLMLSEEGLESDKQWSSVAAVNTVTRLRTGRPGFDLGRDKDPSSSPPRPDRL
jgi:hypothetical protein